MNQADDRQEVFCWLAFRLLALVPGFKPLEPQEQQRLRQQTALLPEQPSWKELQSLGGLMAKAIGARQPKWGESVTPQDLPAVGLTGKGEAFLVLAANADGSWLVETPQATRVLASLPAGCRLGVLQPLNGDSEHARAPISASQMIRRVLAANKGLIVQAALATAFMNFFALLTSLYSMQVYDRVLPTQGLATLYVLTLGVSIGIVLELIGKFTRSYILDHAIRAVDSELSFKIFERLLSIRMDQFPSSVGTLAAQLRTYEQIRSFAASASLYVLVDAPFAILFIVVIAMLGGTYMAAVPLTFFALSLVIGLAYRRKMKRHAREGMAAANRKLGLLVETVEGADAVKANGSGWQLLSRWNQLTTVGIREDMSLRNVNESATAITNFLQQICYVLLVATGAYLAATTRDITSGAIIACSILSGRVLSPAAMLPGLLLQWAHASSAMESLQRIFKLERDNHDVARPVIPQQLTTGLTLQKIKYSYGTEKGKGGFALTLDELEIRPGEKVGILGTVGAGKSTLLKVLSGMYRPDEGRVLMGGVDMQHISRPHLSQVVGYLPQSTRLFAGTLRENLLSGLVGKTDAQVIAIAEKTGLAQLVASHPKGWELPIYEGGHGLSGGQRQLLALTRMLVADPKVWLLDEPTSSMDDGLERRIKTLLRDMLLPEQTLVLVTHKPSMLDLVDRLVVLGAGGIVMHGPTHLVMEQLNKGVRLAGPALANQAQAA